MKLPLIPLAIALSVSLGLYGCNHETSDDAPKIAAEDIAAKVNGVAISKQDVNEFAKLKGNPDIPTEAVLDELVATELLRQEAVKQGIADQSDIDFQIRQQETQLLARALIQKQFADLSFSDEDLRAEYDKQMGGEAANEYRARHILLKTEDEANAVIAALDNGGDFVELAKERSTGPSAGDGGNLGWFQAGSMVPEFAKAVQAMQAGDISTVPVQTQFGYHVIMLEETRPVTPPPFEQVKEQVRQALTRDKITEYVDGIKEAATVETM